MKLIRSAKDQHHFQLNAREKELLVQVLRLYPRIPSGYQPLTKSAGAQESNQRLLEEALEEARNDHKKQLDILLSDSQKLKQVEGGWRLTLSKADVEWLLQVLNDIRIGSWIRLGSPDSLLDALNAETAPHFWAMEMAGSFQMRFLELLGG